MSAPTPTPTAPPEDHGHGAALSNIDPHDGPGHVHVVPKRMLLGIFAALMFCTVLTVAVTYVNLGSANIWVALAVAVVKATLVALFFMHLRWDSPFNSVIFICSLVFVAIFIGVSLMDSHNYQPNMDPPPATNVR